MQQILSNGKLSESLHPCPYKLIPSNSLPRSAYALQIFTASFASNSRFDSFFRFKKKKNWIGKASLCDPFTTLPITFGMKHAWQDAFMTEVILCLKENALKSAAHLGRECVNMFAVC